MPRLIRYVLSETRFRSGNKKPGAFRAGFEITQYCDNAKMVMFLLLAVKGCFYLRE